VKCEPEELAIERKGRFNGTNEADVEPLTPTKIFACFCPEGLVGECVGRHQEDEPA